MMETISILDAEDGIEYVLEVSKENALRAQTDKDYAEQLLSETRARAAEEAQEETDQKQLEFPSEVRQAQTTSEEKEEKLKWPHECVPILMHEYKNMEDIFRNEQVILGGSGVGKCFQMLADRMVKFGYKCTAVQCKNKITQMKKMYRKLLTNPTPTRWPYVQLMKTLYGDMNITRQKKVIPRVSQGQGPSQIQTPIDLDVDLLNVSGVSSGSYQKIKGPRDHSQTCKDRLRIRERHHKERLEFKQELLEDLKQLPNRRNNKALKMTMSEVLEHVAAIIDSSSDESDCLCPETVRVCPKKYRESPYVDTEIPSLAEEEFKKQFRMSRSTFEFVMSLIGPHLNKATPLGDEAICERRQLLVALWVFSNTDTYRKVGVKFSVSPGTSTLFVRRVTKALLKFSSKYIQWPTDTNHISSGFRAISGFPDVIGAIATTYIAIPVLKTNMDIFRNSRGQPSVLLQVVCDDRMRFTHCYAGHVGSTSEYNAFRSSKIFDFLGNPDKFPNDTHLVGNSLYSLHDNLMIPYSSTDGLTFRQKNYNYCLKGAYNVGAKSIGLLKNRFPRLLLRLPTTRMDLVPHLVTACCIVHNICLFREDNFSELAQVIDEENPPIDSTHSLPLCGHEKRHRITAQLPVNLPQYE